MDSAVSQDSAVRDACASATQMHKADGGSDGNANCRRPSAASSGFCCGWDIIKLKIQKRCIFRIKLMQRRCREEVKMTPKKEKHALRAVPQFTLQGSLQLTPVHSSFSSVSKAQSNQVQFRSVPITIRSAIQSIQFRSVPITIRSTIQSIQFRSVPITIRQSPIGCHIGRSRTADGAAHRAAENCSRRRSTADWCGLRPRPARTPQASQHSTSYNTITSHTSHSALQQTPYNTK